MRSTPADPGGAAHAAVPRLAPSNGRGLSLAPVDAAPTLADMVDRAVDSLAPFERSVVQLRYDVGDSISRVAESLTARQDDVSAALMRAYRSIAAGLEGVPVS